MEYDDGMPPARRRALTRAKAQAFKANHQAKRSEGPRREAHYRLKQNAINFLMGAGHAFVNSVDWSRPDPVISVRFTDGGQLHTILSSLDLAAFRILRQQLNG
jgi:hypothetical protein